MPWTLTTPIAVGDLDPSGSYGEVRIVEQIHRSVDRVIHVMLEYGNTVTGEWKKGLDPVGKTLGVDISGQDYLDLVEDSMPDTGETTYEAVKRGLYEYLADKSLIGPGTLT